MQQVKHIRRLLVAQGIIAGIVYEIVGAYYNAIDGTYARATRARNAIMAHNDIDLLFTDVAMPGGMSGPELACEARLIYPQLPVLFTSGHHGQLAAENYSDLDNLLLEKPYNREQLAGKIREALGPGPHTPSQQ